MIQSRPKGRASNKNTRWGKHKLTEILNVLITPYMKQTIELLIEKQFFPDKSEFVRHLILKYFEDNKEWIR